MNLNVFFFVSTFFRLLVPWVTCFCFFHTLFGLDICYLCLTFTHFVELVKINVILFRLLFFFFFAMAYSLWDLSFLTRDWTWAMQVKAQSPNHWTTMEVCKLLTFRLLHLLLWSYFLDHVTCGVCLLWE